MLANHDLFCAIAKNNIEDVESAIRNGADVNIFSIGFKDLPDDEPCPTHEWYTPEPRNYYGDLKVCFDKHDNNCFGQPGIAALHLSAYKGNRDIVNLLLQNGANPYIKDFYGSTALHYAGSKDVVELLIEKGIDVDVKGEYGRTPLQEAARTKKKNAAKALIEKGASIYVTDEHGRTALYFACHIGDKSIAQLIIKEIVKLNIDIGNKDGRTPLHAAVYSGNEGLVKLLIRSGANVNVIDAIGTTPLHLAAQRNYKSITKLLLKKGAIITYNKAGSTPLSIARYYKHTDIISLLEPVKDEQTTIESTMAAIIENNRSNGITIAAVASTGISLSKRSIPNILDTVDMPSKAMGIEGERYQGNDAVFSLGIGTFLSISALLLLMKTFFVKRNSKSNNNNELSKVTVSNIAHRSVVQQV